MYDFILIHCYLSIIMQTGSVSRRFFWSDVNLWPQELPPNCLVVLHAADRLLHAAELHRALSSHGTALLHHPSLGHAEYLLVPYWQERIVASFARLMRETDAEHAKTWSVRNVNGLRQRRNWPSGSSVTA